MRGPLRAGLLLLILALAACTPRARTPASPQIAAHADEDVWITILHFNDVYEITPVGGGRWGGPARVATLRRQLLARNPRTLTVLAGDLLSPSALGTASVAGRRVDGQQMVATLNALGLDYATFGNHEFDLPEAAFRQRLRESRFQWLSVNVSAAGDSALPNVVHHVIRRFAIGPRDTLRVALFGVTMDRDQAAYAPIAYPLPPAEREAQLLRDSADIVIAVTHLPLAQDIALADASPGIDLILGGHEHENLEVRRGARFIPIAKADANVRTVFVHELHYGLRSHKLDIASHLVSISDSIPDDPATLAVVQDWVERAYDGFRQLGFKPEVVVARSPVALDGLRASVRVDTTVLTAEIARAMQHEATGAEAALYNAGSIRVDDVLPAGPVTQYDVIRVLPFGGLVVLTEMRGSLLRRVLEQGLRNRGGGGFLQYTGIAHGAADGWSINDQPLDDARIYRVALTRLSAHRA